MTLNRNKIYNLRLCDTARTLICAGHSVLVGAMKIVKGDTVYLRSGKDVSAVSVLPKSSHTKPMAEQIDEANRIKIVEKDKSVRGRVLRVLPDKGKVLVEGVNMVTKHQRPQATGGAAAVQQGGRISIEAPIPVSRVMLICPHCNKPTRVGTKVMSEVRDGKTKSLRQRVCKQCNEIIIRPTTL